MEIRLDCKLFDRLGRSILPTTEANLLYPKALAILDDIQKLKDSLAVAGKSVAGDLVIGASTIPGAYLLPSLASTFKQQHSQISFEIRIDDSANIISGIVRNELMLGVVGAKLPEKKISYYPFVQDELILVAAETSSLPEKVDSTELPEQPFILREAGSGTRKSVETFLAQQDIGLDKLKVVATLGSSTAVKEAVKAGLGVSIISRHAVVDELRTGSVKEIAISSLEMKRQLYIATATKRTLPHHYQVFLEFLQHPPFNTP